MTREFRDFLAKAVAVIPLIATAQAATYYVSVSGNDGNAGTASAPFRHVSKGVGAAVNPGDTVIIMDGTYDNEGVTEPNYVVTLYHSGTSGNPITIMAQNRGKAILDAGNTSNSTCTGAASYFNLYNASFVVIQGLVLQNSCDQGLQSNDSAHDITIRWNEIRNVGNWYITDQYGRDGIYLNNSEYNFTFDGNVFHDIGRVGGVSDMHFDHGIYTHATNVTIINNVFYNISKGWSVEFADGAANYLIANNTFAFANASGEAGQIMFWGSNTGVSITNNIFYNPASSALNQYGATVQAEFDHNLVYGVGTIMSNGGGVTTGSGNQIGPNPLFTNASSSPFSFTLGSGSPAIGAGANLTAVSTDIMGNARPSGSPTDLGAYQSGSVSSNVGTGSAPTQVTLPSITGVFTSSVTQNSAYVNWSTNVPTSSYVQYGPTGYTSSTPVNGSMVQTHSMQLTGLQPGATYHFRAAGNDGSGNVATSGDYTLTTQTVATTFALPWQGTNIQVTQGQSTTLSVPVSLQTGAAVTVSFSATGDSGISASFSQGSCMLNCTSVMTVGADSTLAPGQYTLTVTVTGAGTSTSGTVGVTVVAAAPPPALLGDAHTGLVARWMLNETSGTVAHDISGYNNNATVTNGFWWNSAHGPTLWFDGSGSYASINESASLEMTNTMTVAFWMDPNAQSGGDPRIIAKLYDWDIKLNGVNTRYPQFETSTGQYAILNFSPGLQTWHHVAFVYNKGKVTGYVDGKIVPFVQNTFTGSGTLAQWKYGLYMGWDAEQQNPFIGSLQDVRIYNRALSTSDIAAVLAGH